MRETAVLLNYTPVVPPKKNRVTEKSCGMSNNCSAANRSAIRRSVDRKTRHALTFRASLFPDISKTPLILQLCPHKVFQ